MAPIRGILFRMVWRDDAARRDYLRSLAVERASELRVEVEAGDQAATGWVDAAEHLAIRLLGAGRRVCDFGSVESCGDSATCTQRCQESYWRSHSRHVSELLVAIAAEVRAPVDVWRVVGLVHDADYVAFPHHVPEVDPRRAHPLALLGELAAVGAPASVRLAILEHAAHTRLRPTSALSAALIIADEHSTMTAFAFEPHYGRYQAHPVIRALHPAPHRVGGYRRPDMDLRSLDALAVLLGR